MHPPPPAAACEKSIACSTCHVILDPESFDKLEEPSDEENVREDRSTNGATNLIILYLRISPTGHAGYGFRLRRHVSLVLLLAFNMVITSS